MRRLTAKKQVTLSLILILFLPDYYRRLWLLTRSADLLIGALAGSPINLVGIPPVGTFTPP